LIIDSADTFLTYSATIHKIFLFRQLITLWHFCSLERLEKEMAHCFIN